VLSDTKRTRVKEVLHSGLVHINGVSSTRHDILVSPTDSVEIRDERATTTGSLPFEVIYEDATLIVINKPNGVLTVGNKHEKKRTVEAIINQALADQRQRCFVVQRLDLYTSGVLLLAKTEAAAKNIKDNWGQTDKVYHALIEGTVHPPQATITHYLSEDERLVVHASESAERHGVEATLSYETLKRSDAHSLILVRLKTGKKNQIRAQMSALGHPIAGDAKYGATTNPIQRLCLHASCLTIKHPKSGQQISFTALLPEGMDHIDLRD
jgi:23S rRNA pseudouridine1911/1915/1917 synthase